MPLPTGHRRRGFGYRLAGSDKNNSDISIYFNGTEVVRTTATAFSFRAGVGVTITDTGLTITAGGMVVTSGTVEINDDVLFTLGADNDQAAINRSTSLSANTAVTGLLIGTPAVAAVPANSLIVANITADGDQVFVTVPAAGVNSIEWLRNDASAGLTVFNEAAGDIDLRIEGDNNANMLVVDAGTDSMALGSAVVAGAPLSISNVTGRTLVTAVGNALHIPAGSLTDGGGTGTIATLDVVRIGARTILATNTITYTDAVGLHVLNPIASTGATFTNIRTIHSEGNIQIGAMSAFGTTQPTATLVIKTGTAPVGAVTTSVGLYTDGTTMKKIIADGTASDVQT